MERGERGVWDLDNSRDEGERERGEWVSGEVVGENEGGAWRRKWNI